MKIFLVDSSEIAARSDMSLLARDYLCSDGTIIKKWKVSVDFDGVLHQDRTPWVNADVIPDPPTPGSLEFIQECFRNGVSVAISSCRAKDPKGKEAIEKWLEKYGFPVMYVGAEKLYADVYIDDRAYRFTGNNWPSMSSLAALRPWTKTPK